MRKLIASLDRRKQIERIDQAIADAAGLAAVQTAAVDEPRVFVTDVTDWSNIITLLQTIPANIQIGVIAANRSELRFINTLRASLPSAYQARLHVGVGRASLIGALREHFGILEEETAQLVVPGPVFNDHELHEAILLRAWTLTGKYRLVEFSLEGLTAPGHKISVTLDSLLQAFTVEAEARMARERAA